MDKREQVMKTARSLLGAVAICVGLIGATDARSQSNVPVPSTWNCEQLSNLTQRNVAPTNMQQVFRLTLASNGSAQAQGQDTAQWGTFPFQASGRWQIDQGNVVVLGQINGGAMQAWARSNGFPITQEMTQFFFASQPQNPDFMSLEVNKGNETTGYSRIMTRCQRLG